MYIDNVFCFQIYTYKIIGLLTFNFEKDQYFFNLVFLLIWDQMPNSSTRQK